jgi:hypothetical protein
MNNIRHLPIPGYTYHRILMIKFDALDRELDLINERLERVLG